MYFGNHPDDCNCQLHQLPVFTLAAENRTTVANRAIENINKADSPAINSDLFQLYSQNYTKALDSVFNDISPTHPMWEKVQQYRLNTANFAAHKAYKVTDEIKTAENAKAVISKYNRFQAAEYNTVVSRSRTAKQFETFQQEKHLYPNLEWIRTRSANPRELHLSYVGIVLPINHPFWSANQPGNLWNCKCDWKTTDTEPTAEPTKITPAAKGLEGNPYDTGELITKKHPYFQDAPAWVEKNSKLLAPYELVYSEIKTKEGKLMVHILSENESGYKSNVSISKILLENKIFNEIKLLPEISETEQLLRKKYYGIDYCNNHYSKCPDILADNTIVEIKQHTGGKRSLKSRLKEAAEKSDIIIIKIENMPEKQVFENIINGAFNNFENLKRIVVFNNKNELILNKITKAN